MLSLRMGTQKKHYKFGAKVIKAVAGAGILIKGAVVLTQDSQRKVLRNCDILIEGSRIAKVAKGVKEKAEFVLNARNKIAMPGLVNAHTHAAMSLFRGLADDMTFWEAWPGTVWPRERKLKARHVLAGARLAMLEMIRSGTTCFADFYFFPEQTARAARELGLRACVGSDVQDGRTPHARNAKEAIALSERFIKKFRNDSLISPVAYAHAPYTCSAETMLKVRELAEKYDVRMHTHLSETRKEVFELKKKTGMRPVEYIEKIGFLCSRLAAAHCAWMTKSEVSMLARAKASVVHCPVSNMKLASGGAAPVPEMVAAGVNVALGTDGPASNNSLDMFDTMKFAALLHKNWRWDPRAVPAQVALDFATLGGARSLGVDAGSLEEGRLADIVLLDLNSPNLAPLADIPSLLVYSANPSNVTDVIVNGRMLMRDGRMWANAENILRQARKAAVELAGA